MRHLRISLCILLLTALLIAGCGAPAVPSTGDAAAPAAGGAGKTKVVIFIGMGTGTDPDQIKAQEDLAAKFNSSHEDIEVEFLIVPHDQAGERFLAMVSGGNAPQLVGPNGISTVAQFFDSWADVAPFIDAEGFDTSDFYGPAVELNHYPDKTVGLPLGLFPSFIFYNKDMFDAAGLAYPTHDYNDTAWNLEALRDMANRCDVPDMTNFIAAVIQADQLGVSLAKVLRIQSEQMRVKRRQRAEELANQAPVKMVIPLVFLVFPSILIVLLGPAVLQFTTGGGFGIR